MAPRGKARPRKRRAPTPPAPAPGGAYLQPADPDESVWRYMDLAKYIDLLGRRQLHLRRIDRFADPFEGTLPAACAGTGRSGFLQRLRAARRHTYVNCWRLGREESEAMWQLYCGSTGGIAIVLPYRRLAEAAAHMGCEIGLVRYVDYAREDPPELADIIQASLCKRIAFAHEREVRLVRRLAASSARRAAEPPDNLHLDWDPERWVERVALSPLSAEYFSAAVHRVTEALAPKLVGRITPSEMARLPTL